MELKETDFFEIELRPKSGSQSHKVAKEAMRVALDYECDVRYEFNDVSHRVSYNKLKGCVD